MCRKANLVRNVVKIAGYIWPRRMLILFYHSLTIYYYFALAQWVIAAEREGICSQLNVSCARTILYIAPDHDEVEMFRRAMVIVEGLRVGSMTRSDKCAY